MTNTISNRIFFYLLILPLFFACNDITNVGEGIIPEEDLIYTSTTDTFDIKAYTYKNDSILTSSSNYAIVGNYKDPVFGFVKSSFVTQTKIGVPTDFSDAILDSVILQLAYKTTEPYVYGNKENQHKLYVYEIDYDLTQDTAYYSNFNQNLITKKHLLSNTTYSYNSKDNDSILYIKLDNDYGQRIIDGHTTWSDATFNNYFNGIWIKSDDTPEDAAISFFDLASAETKLSLYYHNSNESTLNYEFILNTTCLRANLFDHDYNSGNIITDLSTQTQIEDSVLYIQGLQGLKSKIVIPGLDNFSEDKNWAVNRAELVFSVADNSYTFESSYPAPENLSIFGISENDELIYLNQYLTTNAYLGIAYSENKYKFDVTQRVQQIIRGTAINGFYIIVRNGYEDPSRVILGGSNHSNNVKLVLTLTKI